MPLVAKTRRSQHEDASSRSSSTEFRDNEACLNRLAQSDFIRDENSAPIAAQNGDGRLELIRQDVNPGVASRAKKSGHSATGEQRASRSSPS